MTSIERGLRQQSLNDWLFEPRNKAMLRSSFLSRLRSHRTASISDREPFSSLPIHVQQFALHLVELTPNGRCEIVADAGHLVGLDQPHLCTKLMLDFLR